MNKANNAKSVGLALVMAIPFAASALERVNVATHNGAIESSGTQYLNTGYTVSDETVLDMHFSGWKFGTRPTPLLGYGRYDSNAFLLLNQYENPGNRLVFWSSSKLLGYLGAGTNYHVHIERGCTYADQNGFRSTSDTSNWTVVDAAPLCIFSNGPNNQSGGSRSSFKLHDLRMWSQAGGPLVRDFIPCTHTDGRIGMYDRIESKFYPNAGTGAFALTGDSCTFDGANLTLAGGAFSYRDDTLTDYTLNGTLALSGGTTLEFEVGGVRSDSLTVKSLTLNAASDNRVTIAVDQVRDGFIATGSSLPILSGGNLTAADLDKFEISTTLPLELAIEGGNLVLRTTDSFPAGSRTVHYIRSTGTQYVLTGVKATFDTEVEMEFGDLKSDGNTDGVAIMGLDIWTSSRFLLMQQGGRIAFYGANTTLGTRVNGADYFASLTGGRQVFSQDGLTATTAADANAIGTSNNELAIFGQNYNRSRNSSFKLYRMKITAADGTRLRDYRPCVNVDGTPGLWECVSQTFVGNKGIGRFLVPGEVDNGNYPVAYIESTGTQALDTMFYPTSNTVVEANFGHWTSTANAALFGLNRYNSEAFLFLQQDNKFCYYGNPRKTFLATVADKDFFLHLEAKNIFMTNATEKASNTAEANVVHKDAGSSLTIFAMRDNGCTAYIHQSKCRLYDFKLWKDRANYDAGTPSLSMVPIYNAPYEGAGLFNQCNKLFYGSATASKFNHSAFANGLVAKTEGTKLIVPGGTIAAANIPTGCTEVNLASAGTLVSTACLVYPALTLDAGTFSLKDNAAETCTISGALKLTGGVKIALDKTDVLTAGSVDLTAASRNNPILFVLADPADFSGIAKVIVGGNLTASDAEKFAAPGVDAKFKVRNGDLCLCGKSGMLIYLK